MKTVYTNGDQKTESVSYRKGERERFEFGEILLLKQHDLKRTIQIMKSANSYMVIPDGAAMTPAAVPNSPPKTPGIVTMTTTIVDTGERKTVFGLQARHVKTTMDKQPAAGACDPTKQHIETDGWYVDLPIQAATPDNPQTPASCEDQVKLTQTGDPKVLGFPVSYAMTVAGDGKSTPTSMEIVELEITNLDAALFEVPAGLNQAGDLASLTRAVSDANEAKLTRELTEPAVTPQKAPGAVLIGVPEVLNKTAQQIDTRALRGRLVSDLADAKLNAAPLPAAQGDVLQLAGSHGYDYLLVAEITDLKVSKGGLGGMLKAASKVTGSGNGEDPTEAALTIKLVQPDGKTCLSTTVKGKNGGLDLKTGLGVAKFAGGMYMNMMTGKMMMNALNKSVAGNLGGLKMLGDPSLVKLQTQGLGMSPGMRMGFDPTAGAASFLMDQSMASAAAMKGGALGQTQSFDAALNDAFENAAKTVAENLKKGTSVKK
jgi:hypothetical protein